MRSTYSYFEIIAISDLDRKILNLIRHRLEEMLDLNQIKDSI